MTQTRATTGQDGDLELKLIRALTRMLPRIRGAGVLGNKLTYFYQRKPRSQVVSNVLGLRMILDPHECVDSALLFMPQLHDHNEVSYLRSALCEGDVFMDIGANIGFYSLMASRCVGPTGKVYSIEAEPSTYEALVQNIELNGCENIVPINLGISNQEEILSMLVSQDNPLHRNRGGNSFLHSSQGETKQIKCVPLASVMRDHGITRLDAIKIDTEGFEYRILRSFLDCEPAPALIPKFIILEQNPGIEDVEGDSVALLQSHGYTTYRYTRRNNYIMSRTGRGPTVR